MSNNVNVTFTANSSELTRVAQAGANAISGITNEANQATRSVSAAERQIASLSKSVNFHGNRRASQIASEIIGRATSSQVGAKYSARPSSFEVAGLASEGRRIKAEIQAEVRKIEAAKRFVEKHFAGMTPSQQSTEKRSVGTFIRNNGLGDINDTASQAAAILMRRRMANVDRINKSALAAAGGNASLLKSMQASGVDISNPWAVAHGRVSSEILVGKRNEAARIAKRKSILDEMRFNGLNTEDPRAVQSFRDDKALRLMYARDGSRDAARALAEQEKSRAAKEKAQSGDAASRQRMSELSGVSAQQAYFAKMKIVAGAKNASSGVDLIESGSGPVRQAQKEAVQVLNKGIADAIRKSAKKNAATRESDLSSAYKEGASPEVIRNALQKHGRTLDPETVRALSGRYTEGIASKASADKIERDAIRRERIRGIASTGMSVASGVSAAAGAGIMLGESTFGAYTANQDQRALGIAGVERMFRERIGMTSGNGQRKIRQDITDAAVHYGLPVASMSQFEYDVMSSAGNLGDKKQREIIGSSLKLQSLMGGDLPILGKALVTMEQLFGSQNGGGSDRMSSLIKETVNYGKFSPTGFAQLAPEALSTASLYNIPVEQAMAALAVASTRSGRDENMFTGARYVFSMMGKAKDQGLVKSDDFVTQLGELNKATPDQLTQVFGREGVNVASNLRQMSDEVARFTQKLKGLNGGEVGNQLRAVTSDPVNAISRIAQSVESAQGASIVTMLDNGMPLEDAGNSVRMKAAMIGQSMMAPWIAALTDKTRQTDLVLNKKKYEAPIYAQMRAAAMQQGDTARVAQLDLTFGRQSYTDPGKKNSEGLLDSVISTALVPIGTVLSIFDKQGSGKTEMSADDLSVYNRVNKQYGITATSSEFKQIRELELAGNQGGIDAIVARSSSREKASKESRNVKPVTDAMSGLLWKGAGMLGMQGGSIASPMIAGISAMLPEFAGVRDIGASIMSGQGDMRRGFQGLFNIKSNGKMIGKIQQKADEANQAYIEGELSSADKDKKSADDDGRLFDSANAASRKRAILMRREELSNDRDGFTAVDRATLADEIKQAKKAEAANAGDGALNESASTFKEAVTAFAQAVGQLNGQKNGEKSRDKNNSPPPTNP